MLLLLPTKSTWRWVHRPSKRGAAAAAAFSQKSFLQQRQQQYLRSCRSGLANLCYFVTRSLWMAFKLKVFMKRGNCLIIQACFANPEVWRTPFVSIILAGGCSTLKSLLLAKWNLGFPENFEIHRKLAKENWFLNTWKDVAILVAQLKTFLLWKSRHFFKFSSESSSQNISTISRWNILPEIRNWKHKSLISRFVSLEIQMES